jgi:hypothetical protein
MSLIGNKVGELTILGIVGKNLYQCKCSCGKLKIVSKDNLENLIVTDCGHIEKESGRLKRIYNNIKDRCYNPKASSYKYYGQRGIEMCNEWYYSFSKFYKWSIENGYSKDLTIERIDNDKNYSPENCKWATLVEQNNNRRNCHYLSYNGTILTLSQWAKKFNMSAGKLIYRINKFGENKTFEKLLEGKDVL